MHFAVQTTTFGAKIICDIYPKSLGQFVPSSLPLCCSFTTAYIHFSTNLLKLLDITVFLFEVQFFSDLINNTI